MREIKFHRNAQKRFYGDDKIYFITTNTRKRFPYFKEDLLCELFIENLRLCKRLKGFKLYAFTIIPNHAHLQLHPVNKYNISEIMQSLKKSFSRDVNNFIRLANKEIFPIEGEIHESRLQLEKSRLQGIQFSYHKNKNFDVPKYKYYFNRLEKFKNIPLFKWQQSFHDHVIRGEKDFRKHIKYIHNNCLKHAIHNDPETYPWSSMNQEFEDLIES